LKKKGIFHHQKTWGDYGYKTTKHAIIKTQHSQCTELAQCCLAFTCKQTKHIIKLKKNLKKMILTPIQQWSFP
jgi:hypothetical protein